ncbi:unnamed protein product [Brachionus calyciflorus]|uniref:Succinate dehydrogenase [ubiquinone] cytochrome b small subunit n=1 Tax=Brachionus calyciflorus TaxID=104777 RepID=A0A813N4G8_9BILA|nr:unnamed protein product [Brachionus calyciflorus]
MSSVNLLRGGFRSINSILRPYSTVQSSFNGRNATLAKKNILFVSGQQNQIAQQSRVPLNQYIRAVASVHPHRSPLEHDEKAGLHWSIERYLAVGLLAIIPGSILLETSVTDYLLAAALVVHANWGCRSIIVDYIHGKQLPKIALAVLYSASFLAFVGLCYFNYSDVGLSKAIKKIWSL